MRLIIRPAGRHESAVMAMILGEAARRLEQRRMTMWKAGELTAAGIEQDVQASMFFLAECDGEPAGTVKYQLEDLLFWPDVPQRESAFLHRLAVRRNFAGGEVSFALMRWAVERTHSLGRRYLRLDCEASRPVLRAVYERFGFRHHSDRAVGPYFVSRYQYEIADF